MAFNLDSLADRAPNLKKARKKAVTPRFSVGANAKALASALDQLGIVSITDIKGNIVHANDAFLQISQFRRKEVLGKNHAILNSGYHPPEFWAAAYQALSKGQTWRAPVKNRAKDGTLYWVDALILPLKGRRKQITGYLSFQIDITTAVNLHIALQERNALLQAIVDSFPGGLTVFDRDLRIKLINEKQRQLLEYPDELFEGGLPTLEELYRFNANRGEYGPGNPEEQVRSRVELARKGETHIFERRRPNGTYLEIRGTPLQGGGFVTAHLDITDRKRDQETIGRLENHDALTGLPNRALFQERIRHGLMQMNNGMSLALHCLGIDRFKSINETLGPQVGDALLIAVGERLRSEIRDTDTVARIGGDEFAVIQMAPQSIEEIEALAKRILFALSEPFELGKDTVSIGTSIGIAVGPSDGNDAEQLLMNADMALYRTKSVGRGTFGFFEQSMHERLQKRHQIIMGLHEAIANSKFELHYQPIVNVNTRRIVGCEALIRWSHPVRGLIPASEFIPIAEECGLIGQIGEWVLKRACAEASLWPDDIWVAVNVSPAQFRDPDLVEKITNAAKTLPLSRLILEITETLLMKDQDAVFQTLEQLRRMGIRFSIDDFGTGFSSLSYLQSFPFDKIKIDRSFVSTVSNVKRSSTLRRSIIQLGYNLGMTSVAEGVETEQQLDRLRAEGCVEAQGFLFSRAVPAAKLRTLFANPL
ncbi:MAG: EAL domain-containing protein [Proteobacteria bacterium]|nr:EAL domain-containing protein [Pseudomonadota bacterium]